MTVGESVLAGVLLAFILFLMVMLCADKWG